MLETTKDARPIVFDPDEIAKCFAHVEENWPRLTRRQTIDDGTLIGLPYPYVVPSVDAEGGFTFQEMYYWDNYFVIQGLFQTGRHELAEGMLENILYLARRFHIIPNANRFYFSSRSQPPFLTSFIFDVYDKCEKNLPWLEERIKVAEKEYNTVWTGTTQPNIRNVYKGLSRYYDINVLDDLAEAESGWDMTTRFGGRCLSFIPIDLNSLLYKYELDFERAYRLFGDIDTAEVWHEKAQKRAEVMNEELWNTHRDFYFDLDYQEGVHSHVWSLAAFYALWSGVATTQMAASIVSKLHLFLYEGGLATTASPHDTFDHRSIPKQWAYPNGWAPLHWLAVDGLEKYGYHDEANYIARKWIKTNLNYFLNYGVFREAYNVISPLDKPEEGLYPPQTGFGWTNAVFVDLCKHYLTAEELKKV